MNLTFGDAVESAIDSLRGFRRTEFAPFFWILALQLIILALTTQLDHGWAMNLIAPLVGLVGGEASLHYPIVFGYLSIFMGWVESFGYSVLGAVLIPLALIRFYARTDRALSLGAGAAARLVGAVLPTLLAGLAGTGSIWAFQRYAAPQIMLTLRDTAPQPWGDFIAWLGVILGGYAIISLLLYVPIAAVQARTNPIRAIGMGIRFGLRAWLPTLGFAIFFGVPAILVQFVLEKQGAFLLTRFRPEALAVFLAIYATATAFATFFTYMMGARLYRMARGET